MMSSNRNSYGSALEWLSALRQDEAWLSQLQRLQASVDSGTGSHRDDVMRLIGNGETFEFWEIYQHKVEPVVAEVWEIAELSLPKLKIQTIGMLSVEWLDCQLETDREIRAPKKQKKNQVDKLQKPRETMTFRRKSSVLDGHLTLLFDKLTKAGWIEGDEANFKALFAGRLDDDCWLTWKGGLGKGTLVELFKQMVVAKLIIVPEGFTLPAILNGHFKDVEGNWLTGLDKGNGANAKALPFISECVKLLKITPNDGYQDDEDFQSVYDPYDYQDMKLHKR